MLTQDDATWIRANRAELLAGRTESITIYRRGTNGTDTYTGEPITTETTRYVDVVWKEYRANSERELVGGIELREGDARVSFSDNVDLATVYHVERDAVKYEVIAIDERGLGGTNRRECVVRRVT